MLERFTPESMQALKTALELAQASGSPTMGPEHLLITAVRQADPALKDVLGASGLRADWMAEWLEAHARPDVDLRMPSPNRQAGRALGRAGYAAQQLLAEAVGIEHLVLGAIDVADDRTIELLGAGGVDPQGVCNVLVSWLDTGIYRPTRQYGRRKAA